MNRQLKIFRAIILIFQLKYVQYHWFTSNSFYFYTFKKFLPVNFKNLLGIFMNSILIFCYLKVKIVFNILNLTG